MSVYGKQIHEDVELINEGFLVGLSKEGKELKKELQEELKSYDEKYSFKKALTTNFNKNIQAKVEKLIRSKFNKVFISTIVETETTVNGATSYSYTQQVVALYKNNLYTIKILYSTSYARINSFKELDLEKCTIPVDVLENVLSWNKRNYLMKVTKNKISLENLSYNSFDYSTFDNIVRYCATKHPEIDCRINKLTKSISFKKSSK